VKKNRFILWIECMEAQYVRPFLIYKYKASRKRIEFEFEDILKEYQIIEEELNVDSDEDEDLLGVPKDLRSISHQLANNRLTSEVSQSRGGGGLLAQYI